ncbi:hypothetical protein F4679DRAFT_532920 [Xylaria curta]|nr:hypothetical protein F4679DRAFT_532920 [Xylaria curta]
MERDLRRDQGEWRGCHKFDKIICDGDLPTNSERRGGLKMGQKYYYYYEIDGSTETYNPSLPTTTACPFLPGQTVNTLDVPVERRTRMKSASMNSLRNTDYKTMEPADRFKAPRLPAGASNRRDFSIASAMPMLPTRATRSVSPAPSWTGTARRFLRFKSHNRDQESDRGRKSALKRKEEVVEEQEPSTDGRSVTPTGSIRSRDMSPESLRRFLSDDLPSSSSSTEPTPGLSIPDDIEEEIEDNDDDDNFATTTVYTALETAHFTNLSPPPFQRGGLSAPPASHSRPATADSAVDKKQSVRPARLTIPRSHSSASMASSSMASTASPISNVSRGLSQFSFFDDSDDEELDRTLIGDEKKDKIVHTVFELRAPITSYSLPRTSSDSVKHLNTNQATGNDSSSFFRLPNVDISLDDLDTNWMNTVIQKDI